MFLINTRSFPPEIGGMQMLMGGLSNNLLNYGPVKIFADDFKNSELYDQKFGFDITRVSGIKLFRKFRKINLVNNYLKQNPSIKAIIVDHWKSLENLNKEYLLNKKTFCLIHSKEINHPTNSRLNSRMINSMSKANFILCHVENGIGQYVYKELAKRGIFVRYYDTVLLKDYIRTSVGLRHHNQALVTALHEILGQE